MEKTFVLVWKLKDLVKPIIEGSASICQAKRMELKKEPQFKSGKLILRTKEGLKNNPMWNGKNGEPTENTYLKTDTMEKFKDSKGNIVKAGDKIKIISNYNYQFLNGIEAEVVWDEKNGMYRFMYSETRRAKTFTNEHDFYGIHEFIKINQ